MLTRIRNIFLTITIASLIAATIPLSAAYADDEACNDGYWDERFNDDGMYEVATAEDLHMIRECPEGHFLLVANIDLSETVGYNDWEPIGPEPFTGTLDGNGFAIIGLNIHEVSSKSDIDDAGEIAVGLFRAIGEKGIIKNLRLDNANIQFEYDGVTTLQAYVGALAGKNEGRIENVAVTGLVNSESAAGGLVGFNAGLIVGVEVIPDSIRGRYFVGGLVGQNAATIALSQVTGSGSVSGTGFVGGLVGGSTGAGLDINVFDTVEDIRRIVIYEDFRVTIDDTELEGALIYNSRASVRVQSGTNAGGLAGLAGYSILYNDDDSVAASGDVEGKSSVGGVAGSVQESILYSMNAAGDVIGELVVGGVAGDVVRSIFSETKASGNVEGLDTVGGIAGAAVESTLFQTEASGDVQGEDYVGGVAGMVMNSTFFETEASGDVQGENYVGGIAGMVMNSTFSETKASGDVEGTDDVGGVAGRVMESEFSETKASGYVEGLDTVGGIAGVALDSTFFEIEASGDVQGEDYVGGVAGVAETSIFSLTEANGDVKGENQVGGAVGYSNGSAIYLTEASGSVRGVDAVGGLAGYAGDTFISFSLAMGNVEGVRGVGGLVGVTSSTNPGDVSDMSYDGTLESFTASEPGLDSFNRTRPNIDSFRTLKLEKLNNIDAFSNKSFNFDPFSTLDYDVDSFKTAMPSKIGVSSTTGFTFNTDSLSMFKIKHADDGDDEETINGYIFSSGAQGRVRGQSLVGGLVGFSIGAIAGSYAAGQVIGVLHDDSESHEAIGGLVGFHSLDRLIFASYAIGDVSAKQADIVGGFVGRNYGEITDSYAHGDVIGRTEVGGFAGLNYFGEIKNAYSIGHVTGDTPVGAFVGQNDGTLENNYWNTTRNRNLSGIGIHADDDDCEGCVIGLTDAQMKEAESYEDYDDWTWSLDSRINNGYPYLLDVPLIERDFGRRRTVRDPEPDTSVDSNRVTKQDGGTIVSEDGRLTLEFRAGSVQDTVHVAITPVPADETPDAPGYVMISSSVYRIEVRTLDGEAVTLFDHPFTLTFNVTNNDLPHIVERRHLHVFYYDVGLGRWVAIPTRINEDGTITAYLNHLTVFSLMEAPDLPRLTDIRGHWAEADITKLLSLTIVNGVGNDRFAPEGIVTRAEFAKMIVGAIGLPVDEPVELSFVDSENIPDWARGYVAAAANAGIVTGMGGNRFGPNELITREQMATMIARALKLEASPGATDFLDDADIAVWSRASLRAAVQAGIIKGMSDGRFLPKDNATRAQAATMVARALEVRSSR